MLRLFVAYSIRTPRKNGNAENKCIMIESKKNEDEHCPHFLYSVSGSNLASPVPSVAIRSLCSMRLVLNTIQRFLAYLNRIRGKTGIIQQVFDCEAGL